MTKVHISQKTITLEGHCREHDACMNLTGIVNLLRGVFIQYNSMDKIKVLPGLLMIDREGLPEEVNTVCDVFGSALKGLEDTYPGNIVF